MAALALLSIAVVAAQPAAGDAARGAAAYAQRCALCHGAAGAGGGQGPALGGVVGRQAGSSARFGCSRALRAAGERGLVWDAAALDRFLAAPDRAVPGTAMSFRTRSAEDRADIIAYLATLTAAPPGQGSGEVARTPSPAPPPDAGPRELSGAAAFGDWRQDAPGVRRSFSVADLPPPQATRSARNPPLVVDAPAGAVPRVPAGFRAERFAERLSHPRLLRTAPNGDVFVAETAAGRIRALRPAEGGARAGRTAVFAVDLDAPFGIAFYPPGAAPEWVYVAEENAVVRFPYRAGDLEARGPMQVVVAALAPTRGGHVTRDLAFSPDGKRLFVSVGSLGDHGENMGRKSAEEIRAWEEAHGMGAAWGGEERRAAVLVFDPDGKGGRTFASGLRNCVGLAVHPRTGDLWCSTNERDGLGDDLVPDHATRVRDGAFYGWPWYYLGAHEEPRRQGERPDLAGRITVPDVLLQAHSASLQLAFYDPAPGAAAAFPAAFSGDGFAAFHGSWNRSRRTGYKVVRLRLRDGVPTGEVEDFLTGFVLDDERVWGRPVGVAVGGDGALLVSEDGNGTIWRVAPVRAR